MSCTCVWFLWVITEQLSKEDPKMKTFSLSYSKAFMYPAKCRPNLYWKLLVHQNCHRQVILLSLSCLARVAFWCCLAVILTMFFLSFWDVRQEIVLCFSKVNVEIEQKLRSTYEISVFWIFQVFDLMCRTELPNCDWVVTKMTNVGRLGAQCLPLV